MIKFLLVLSISVAVRCEDVYYDHEMFANSTNMTDKDYDELARRAQATVCVNPANSATGSQINLFVWTEYEADRPTFFANLMTFILGNCAYGRVTRLVMRMATPTPMWLPRTTSPFYSQFLRRLHGYGIVIELALFPYMMVPTSRIAWGNYIGKIYAPIEGAVQFMYRWNALISDSGFRTNFKGLVFDYEERKRGWASYPAIDIDAGTIARLRNSYGNFELGVTIGWDDVSKFDALPWVNVWYLQMYDLYDRSGALDRTSRSPFIVYRNNPQGLVNYFMNVLITPYIRTQYNNHASKIFAMWSIQSPNNQCLYIYSNGVCVGNSEFGLWSGSAFNLFINKLMYAWPAMRTARHGLYHFGLLPLSWIQ
jgi:hypothetical protein